MKKLFALVFLFGMLTAFTAAVKAEVRTVTLNFEEYAGSIGEDNAWLWTQFIDADFGIPYTTEDAYGTENFGAYWWSKGVRFEVQGFDDVAYDMSYWSGVTLSTRTTTTPADYTNDKVAEPGKGNGNSNTYAVIYADSINDLDYDSDYVVPRIYLPTGSHIKSMYVTNTAYTYNGLMYGDDFAHPGGMFPGEYFMVIAYGVNASGVCVACKDIYLGKCYADGTKAILDDWEFVSFDDPEWEDVTELRFVFSGNDLLDDWLNVGTYFALDDIVYEFDDDKDDE